MADSVETVRKFYSSLAAGDAPAAFALLEPEIEWSEAEQSPYEGTFRGAPQIVEGVFQRIGADFDNFAAAPEEFVGQGDRVAVFGRYSGVARTSGKPLSAPFVHSWTVRDGKIARFVQYTDTGIWKTALA